MTQLIYNILILSFSIVYIMDYSGILFTITKRIYKLLNPGKEYLGQSLPKPFSCSLCMTFWIVLFYLMFNSVSLIYSVGIASLFSIVSLVINVLLGFILDKINNLRR